MFNGKILNYSLNQKTKPPEILISVEYILMLIFVTTIVIPILSYYIFIPAALSNFDMYFKYSFNEPQSVECLKEKMAYDEKKVQALHVALVKIAFDEARRVANEKIDPLDRFIIRHKDDIYICDISASIISLLLWILLFMLINNYPNFVSVKLFVRIFGFDPPSKKDTNLVKGTQKTIDLKMQILARKFQGLIKNRQEIEDKIKAYPNIASFSKRLIQNKKHTHDAWVYLWRAHWLGYRYGYTMQNRWDDYLQITNK